jgi:hypothetical protein
MMQGGSSEAYNDKKQHLKRFYSKIVTKIELN